MTKTKHRTLLLMFALLLLSAAGIMLSFSSRNGPPKTEAANNHTVSGDTYNFYISVQNNYNDDYKYPIKDDYRRTGYSGGDRTTFVYWSETSLRALFTPPSGTVFHGIVTNLPSTYTVDGVKHYGATWPLLTSRSDFYIRVIYSVGLINPTIDGETVKYSFKAKNNVNNDTYTYTLTERYDYFGTPTAVGFTWYEDCPFEIDGYVWTGMYDTDLTKARSVPYWYANINRLSTAYLTFTLVRPDEVYTVTYTYTDDAGVVHMATTEGIGKGQRIPRFDWPSLLNDETKALYDIIPYGPGIVKKYTLVTGNWAEDEYATEIYPFDNKVVDSDLMIRVSVVKIDPSPIGAGNKVYIYLGPDTYGIFKIDVGWYGYLETDFYTEMPDKIIANRISDPLAKAAKITVTDKKNISFYGITLEKPSYDAELTNSYRQELKAATVTSLDAINWDDYADLYTDLQAGKEIVVYGVLSHMLPDDDPNFAAAPTPAAKENFFQKAGDSIGSFFGGIVGGVTGGIAGNVKNLVITLIAAIVVVGVVVVSIILIKRRQ